MPVNKVHYVTKINRVAKDLSEDEDWPSDVANEMDVEDGLIWVYEIGDEGVTAFTDFGIENLINLIKLHKDDPVLLKGRDRNNQPPAESDRNTVLTTSLLPECGLLNALFRATVL